MESWNVALCGNGECFLLNTSRTLVRMNKRVKIQMLRLLSDMEEANVPFQYTEGLKEIYFTFLSKVRGDYIDGKVRLSCDDNSIDYLAQTFVHELAHSIDDVEDISEREEISHERKCKGKHIEDKYAKRNASEYFAVGFEVYYFGEKKDRDALRRHNPVLFKTIKGIHRKYRSR